MPEHRATKPGDSAIEAVDAGEDPSQVAARREAGANLWAKAASRLSDKQYRACGCAIAELSVRRVADDMGVSANHVKILLHRARKRLLDGGALNDEV